MTGNVTTVVRGYLAPPTGRPAWRWETVTTDGDLIAHGEWHEPHDTTSRATRRAAVAALRDLMDTYA